MKTLRTRLNPAWIEGSFVAALVVLCALLTVLQYRWTGEISRATLESKRAAFGDQAALLGRSFDAELTNACNALLPYDDELENGNRLTVHAEHFRRWAAGHPRPIFGRLAVAVVERSQVQLYLLDRKAMRFTSAAWPPEWAALRENLGRKISGPGSPPFTDATGTLLEFPIFGRGSESEWMITELDRPYLTQTWLPELVRTCLDRDGEAISAVVVQSATDPAEVVYSTAATSGQSRGRTVSLRFNHRGRSETGNGPRGGQNSWLLTAWPRIDVLETAVATARWRNLALSALLIGLTLAAGLSLLHYTRRARRLAEAQMQFVANVSHELRTPLTVIRGAGHNLLRGIARTPEQIGQYSKLIIQHADQLADMVEQVLGLAGARRKENTATHRVLNLAEVLEQALVAAAPDAAAAGCRVQTEIAANLPNVRGDAAALRRAFQNLLVNAAKHGGIGRRIEVFTGYTNGNAPPMVEVRVADDGPGIPKDEQSQVFESFFRGKMARERQIRGSGLGLSLVREIVKAHDGSVSVQSDGVRGTTFTVRLPVAQADQDKAVVPAQ